MKKWKNRNSNYWKERILREEASKEERASRLAKRTQKAYRASLRRMEIDLNALLVEIMKREGREITRSELYKMEKYKSLREKLSREIRDIATRDNEALDILLKDIAERTYGDNLKGFGLDFNMISRTQAHAIVQQNWTGVHFSSRIWGNAESFNQRVMSDIEDMILTGTNPDTIKKKLIADYGVHYREADRLIRTESSHVFNSAALQSYVDAGITHVEFLAEADCCDLCEPYSENIYAIVDCPTIPVHPNCRCTYLPVIE